MLHAGFRHLSPFAVTCVPLCATIQRCGRIADLVTMSPSVLWDLHRYRFRSLGMSRSEEESAGLWLHPKSAPLPNCSEDKDVALNRSEDTAVARCSANNAPHSEVFHDCVSDIASLDNIASLDFLSFPDLFPPTPFIDCTQHNELWHGSPSQPGLNAALGGINFLDCLAPSSLNRFPIIIDTGASIAISGNKNDFVGSIRPPLQDLRLGGMAQGAKVEGIGAVKWHLHTKSGNISVAVNCYYVPACQARLLSPQRLFNAQRGVTGYFKIEEENATLQLNQHSPLIIDYETHTHLSPVCLASNAGDANSNRLQANLCITDDANQNLTPAQKLLLMWHFRFGHRNLPLVQYLLRLPIFASTKYLAASRAELPRCVHL
jgi:hypothetical protein